MRSRQDLNRINQLMGATSIIAGELGPHLHAPRRLLELGAGDGTLMLRLARRFSREWPQVEATLLDQCNLIDVGMQAAFQQLGWQAQPLTCDALEWAASKENERWDAVVANLFIHHFSEDDIARLFEAVAERTDLFVVCEPRRARLPLHASRLVGFIGANGVTRNDAVLSVRAGFYGEELSAIWPDTRGWEITERPAGLFSHLFVARRVKG
jgi:hypothetical protein